jgi:hypothetical protein
MGIKANFSYSDIEKALNKDLIQIEQGILRIMKIVGEEFQRDAREALNISTSDFPKGNYKDQTANLRSSIGYFILRDNEQVAGSRGTSKGQMAARHVLDELPPKSGYRLVGVAGMDYASYLESKGYNVITSQQEVLYLNLGDRLKKFTKRLSKKGIEIDFNTNF